MARQDALLTVLHVEDDDNDALLLLKACEQARLPLQLHRVADGEVAKAYLLGLPPFGDRPTHPLPQIVVLDLKLPRVDGFEFLKWLRGQGYFRTLHVMVFTASLSRDDQTRALAEGANSYYTKPSSFDGLVKLVQVFRAPPHRASQ